MMKKVIGALTLSSAVLALGFVGANPANAEEVKEGENTYYVVESGDTLSKIAEVYGTQFTVLHANNETEIDHADLIFAGQKLLVAGVDFDANKVVQNYTPTVDTQVDTEQTEQSVVEIPEASTSAQVVPEVVVTANDGSPQYAAERMASATGTDVATWLYIIQAESGNNPHIVNSIGCYGYFQIHPVHGMPAGASVDTQIQYAINIYNSQGFGAWEVM